MYIIVENIPIIPFRKFVPALVKYRRIRTEGEKLKSSKRRGRKINRPMGRTTLFLLRRPWIGASETKWRMKRGLDQEKGKSRLLLRVIQPVR